MTHVSPAELLRERVTELEAIFREMEENRVKIVGANDALRAENERLREQVRQLRDFLAGETNCPCCDESETCLPDCTFADDDPSSAKHMQIVRDLLAKVRP